MDKLVGIPICIIKNLIANAPLAAVMIAAVLFLYYKFSRLLLRKILGEKKIDKRGEVKASNPAELYDSTVKFAVHAGEFLVLLIILIAVSKSVGLLPNVKEVIGDCIK